MVQEVPASWHGKFSVFGKNTWGGVTGMGAERDHFDVILFVDSWDHGWVGPLILLTACFVLEM